MMHINVEIKCSCQLTASQASLFTCKLLKWKKNKKQNIEKSFSLYWYKRRPLQSADKVKKKQTYENDLHCISPFKKIK